MTSHNAVSQFNLIRVLHMLKKVKAIVLLSIIGTGITASAGRDLTVMSLNVAGYGKQFFSEESKKHNIHFDQRLPRLVAMVTRKKTGHFGIARGARESRKVGQKGI